MDEKFFCIDFSRERLNVKSRYQRGRNFEKMVFLSPKTAFFRGWVSNFDGETWNFKRSEGEILKKMIFLSLKKLNSQVSLGKRWVFSDFGYQIRCKYNKIFNFSPLRGGGYSPLSPSLGCATVQDIQNSPEQQDINFISWKLYSHLMGPIWTD